MRQVTHALLTRPPLSQIRLQTEVIRLKCFVRLACVKHAASVHPEPGSNSHNKCFPDFQSFSFEKSLTSGLLFLGRILKCCSWIFCQLSLALPFSNGNSFESFKVISLFSYQGCFCCCLVQQLLYFTTTVLICQQLFYFFVASSRILSCRNQLKYSIMLFCICQYLFWYFLITFIIT